MADVSGKRGAHAKLCGKSEKGSVEKRVGSGGVKRKGKGGECRRDAGEWHTHGSSLSGGGTWRPARATLAGKLQKEQGAGAERCGTGREGEKQRKHNGLLEARRGRAVDVDHAGCPHIPRA